MDAKVFKHYSETDFMVNNDLAERTTKNEETQYVNVNRILPKYDPSKKVLIFYNDMYNIMNRFPKGLVVDLLA